MKHVVRRFMSAFICAAFAAILSAQSVPAGNEPHHKRLIYNNFVRVFDVAIRPGDATADHVHDFDMATVIVGDGTLRVRHSGEEVGAPATNARGAVIINEQTGAPATYRVENTGTTDYHAIEVENVREGGKWPSTRPMEAPGVSVLKETRALTVYDVRLNAQTPQSNETHTGATVVILIDGVVENGGIGGEEPFRLQQPGQWMVFYPGQSHTLSAVNGGEAHVIEVEAH